MATARAARAFRGKGPSAPARRRRRTPPLKADRGVDGSEEPRAIIEPVQQRLVQSSHDQG
jgi:hypothetical protein